METMKNNYMVNVTHALKTPLVTMRALTESICNGKVQDPDQQKVYAGMLLQEICKQKSMVKDALQLPKLQSDKFDFKKSDVAFAELIEPVKEKYSTMCEYLDIELNFPENQDDFPPLHTNTECIQQVISILLDNAIKFVDEGGRITVGRTASGKRCIVSVTDNGAGIDPAVLPHIFERFYKGPDSNNISGNGLVLAIADELINGLKEKIYAESTPGKGSTFTFTISLSK